MREDQPKVPRYYSCILPTYTEKHFRKTLRVPRNLFNNLLEIVQEDLEIDLHFHGGRSPVNPGKKLAIFFEIFREPRHDV